MNDEYEQINTINLYLFIPSMLGDGEIVTHGVIKPEVFFLYSCGSNKRKA